MKKLFHFAFLFLMPALIVGACQRNGVHAGGSDDTYQPRPAPLVLTHSKKPIDEMQGELIRVDVNAQTISVRIENGLVQTFKFDDDTIVMGLENLPQSKTPLRTLAGKEGSEMRVHWKNEGEAKVATTVEVTQIVFSTNKPHGRRK